MSTTFDVEPVAVDALSAVLCDDGLKAVERPRLQVHVKAPPLELAQLGVGQSAVVVPVADLEHAAQGLLAPVG